MSKSRRDSDVDASQYVAAIAARMNDRVTDVSATIRQVLEEEIPELRADARTIDLLGASVEGNVDTILHSLRHDIAVERIEPPTAALEYARRLAQQGVPVNGLVRAYRLGQRMMTELVFAEVHAMDISPETTITVLESIIKTLAEYIDWISQQVVVVYEAERERWLESQNSLRALRVREVLAGRKAVDVDAATTEIRYPLRWHHVALVLWYPETGDGDHLARLQRFVRELADVVEVGASPLFAAADRTTGWVWLPYRAAVDDVVTKIREFAGKRSDAPGIAIGATLPGVEGFRRSHRQALAARAVAVGGGARDSAVIASSDPGLSAAALLSDGIPEVREWVGEVLGLLATDDENDERLRDTLRIFLRAGSSYKAAAEELDMHFNSVKYRVGRAVARRGRPIVEDRLDVELALLVCHWYGSAVLAQNSI